MFSFSFFARSLRRYEYSRTGKLITKRAGYKHTCPRPCPHHADGAGERVEGRRRRRRRGGVQGREKTANGFQTPGTRSSTRTETRVAHLVPCLHMSKEEQQAGLGREIAIADASIYRSCTKTRAKCNHTRPFPIPGWPKPAPRKAHPPHADWQLHGQARLRRRDKVKTRGEGVPRQKQRQYKLKYVLVWRRARAAEGEVVMPPELIIGCLTIGPRCPLLALAADWVGGGPSDITTPRTGRTRLLKKEREKPR